MIVKIKRIDKTIALPQYHSKGAVAFDLYARTTTEIHAHSIARVPLNVIVEIPEGYMLLLKDRSSTAKKKGLLATVGFIDQDYCGEEDELMSQYFNFTDNTVVIERGERLAQAAFVRVDKAKWLEVKKMEKKNRGGFGSTGH